MYRKTESAVLYHDGGLMYAAAGIALVITHETSIGISSAGSKVPVCFLGQKTDGILPSQFIIAITFL